MKAKSAPTATKVSPRTKDGSLVKAQYVICIEDVTGKLHEITLSAAAMRALADELGEHPSC